MQKYGIYSIGTSADSAEAQVRIQTTGDVSVAFLDVYTHEPFSNLREAIAKLSVAGHHLVVYAHWGEEYATHRNQTQETIAHDWIDAGEDLVVGGHPHVVQNLAIYKGKPIVYSLGNFVFDQRTPVEATIGAVLGGKFSSDKLIPISCLNQ